MRALEALFTQRERTDNREISDRPKLPGPVDRPACWSYRIIWTRKTQLVAPPLTPLSCLAAFHPLP